MLRRVAIGSVAAALLLAVGAAGCGGRSQASGPAWPKSAGWPAAGTWEEDGGESLDPQVPAEVAAIESSEDAPTLDVLLEGLETPAVVGGEVVPDEPPVEPKIDDTFVPDETIIIIEGDAIP